MNFTPTKYKLQSLISGDTFKDSGWDLGYPKDGVPSLIRAVYDAKHLNVKDYLPGLYRFADWLPINRILDGSGWPITYKSENLATHLGLKNLYITFSGYWPEKGALMKTASFKECEAFSVCGRMKGDEKKILVVASAGNTARAFARVCSENKIPLLLCVPVDNLSALWFDHEIDPCVKLIASEPGADYYDAIHLSNIVCEHEAFFPEGGAKNVARRDGMGTTVLSAVDFIGEIPHYYFQAVGSGTGAIAAYEANLRFINDPKYSNRLMRLFVSQNEPFVPMADAYAKKSRTLFPIEDNIARKQVEEINAKVLSNRQPPYGLNGGLCDALEATNGKVLTANNQEGEEAGSLFKELEGCDIDPAAAIALASLIKTVEKGEIGKDEIVMLNITGGGAERFKKDNDIYYLLPHLVFPIDPEPEEVLNGVKRIFDL